MSRYVFWQGSRGSKGSLALRKLLKERGHTSFRIKSRGSSYRPRSTDVLINWGVRDGRYDNAPCTVLNKSRAMNISSNKLRFFSALTEGGMQDNLLKWSQSLETASYWINNGLGRVYCRTTVTGHSGQGIVLADNEEELIEAPLYTLGVDIKNEFRYHYLMGRVTDVQQKKKMRSERREEEGITVNPLIRNHSNGYIYAREGVTENEEIVDLCKRAAHILGVDFIAFDIIEDTSGSLFLIEGNSAPGLTGTTVEKYADALTN